MSFQVIVGNIGVVCTTDVEKDAIDEYESYVHISINHTYSRAYHEDVTLVYDGEPIEWHEGDPNRESI